MSITDSPTLNRGSKLPHNRHVSTHYVYTEGSDEVLSCDSNLLKQCLNKFQSEEFPKECQAEMDKFKLFCGLRRAYNVTRIKIRSVNL